MGENKLQNRMGMYYPLSWGLSLGYECPYACMHCRYECGPKDPLSTPLEIVDKFVDAAISFKAGRLLITDGEPMLKAQQVFGIVQRLSNAGIFTIVGSTYMGDTKEEIYNNAKLLKKAGLRVFQTSLDVYHFHGHANTHTSLSYIDYFAAIVDSVTKEGITVDIQTVIDKEHLKETGRLMDDALNKKLGIDAKKKSPALLGAKYNGSTVLIGVALVASCGKARRMKLLPPKGKEDSYGCPQSRRGPLSNTLFLMPEGNISTCCSAERGSDFGYGNLGVLGIEKIIENIRTSSFHDERFSERMKLAHEIMKVEFPALLPYGEQTSACEICAPMTSHPEVKERLKKEALFERCF